MVPMGNRWMDEPLLTLLDKLEIDWIKLHLLLTELK